MQTHGMLPSWIRPDLWLDNDHAIQFHRVHINATEIGGALFIHRDKRGNGEWCIGGFQWAGENGPNWSLVSLDPLHVEPSINCLACGEHGFIRAGRWESV